MPTPVRKKFCTIYRRSETEKKIFEAARDADKTKKELEDLKKEMAEMKKLLSQQSNPSSEDTPSKRGRKKSNSED